ncbi:hypothetical protein M3Y96_00836900 [Aphelenchoides besseyi]|nr:hypothetical protein M3Y96_00836900 [Aphelenchoides besseyi]
MTSLLFLLLLSNFIIAAHSVKPIILLLGSETRNNLKQTIAQHFLPDVELDEYFSNNAESMASIAILGQERDLDLYQHIVQSDRSFSISISSVNTISKTTVIVCFKGTNEMSLDELRALHSVLYEISGGIAAIEIGSNAIQTSSLLEHSTFCWASGKLKPEMIDAPAQVILCNGVKPSDVEMLIDVTPFVKTDASISLAMIPQHRFWPSMIVSAASDVENKKIRSTKHTSQPPNARHNRVYGKEKKKLEPIDDAPIQSSVDKLDKLACKYRRSCIDGLEAPSVSTPSPKIQPITSSHPINDDDDNKDFDEKHVKLLCRYRFNCYAKFGIQSSGKKYPNANQYPTEKEEPVTASTASDVENKKTSRKSSYPLTVDEEDSVANKIVQTPTIHVIHDTEDTKSTEKEETEARITGKRNCKFRKSCYKSGKLDLEAIQNAKYSTPVSVQKSTTKEPIDVKDLEGDELKLFCKYRRSCYETGILPSLNVEPIISTKESKATEGKPLDVKGIKEDELKLFCKYRRSCYETGILPSLNVEPIISTKESKATEGKPLDVKGIKEDELKLFCKYRRSCYETGILPSLNVEPIISTKESKATEGKPLDVKGIKEDELKLFCKYRRSCYETGVLPPLNVKPIITTKESKATEGKPLDVKGIKEDELKLFCKYRRSCYKTGVLPPLNVEPIITEKMKTQAEATAKKPSKLLCKYRRSCLERLDKEDSVDDKTVQTSTIEVIDETEEELTTPTEESTIEPQIEDQMNEVQEDDHQDEPEIIEQPKPTVARESKTKRSKESKKTKSTETVADGKRRDPNRYVNKFKTIGKYEKVPKTLATDIDEKEDEQVPETDESEMIVVEELQAEDVEEPEIEDVIPVPTETIEDSHEEDKISAETSIDESVPTEEAPVSTEDLQEPEDQAEEPTQFSDIVDSKTNRQIDEKERLRCKYRRSCLQTGVLPDIKAEQKRPPISLPKPISTSEVKSSVPSDDNKLACKYRYSCYSHLSTSSDAPKEASKGDEKPVEITDKTKILPEIEKEESHEQQNASPVKVNISEVSQEDRQKCKWRYKCYSEIVIAPPKPQKTPTVAKVNRTNCKRFYLSCREALGLPPKERAPIGPNGRRLCRKNRSAGHSA